MKHTHFAAVPSMAAVVAMIAAGLSFSTTPVLAQVAEPQKAAVIVAAPPVFNPPATVPAAGSPVTVGADYRLDVDDTISIGVMRHGDVGGAFRIPPDGLVRLPRLITPVDVRGKTVADLTEEITKKLISEGKLVLHPGQVSVVLIGQRMHRIYLRGNAVRGSEFDLKDGWRFDDLVAIMGGIPQADRVTVQLTNPKRPTPLTVDIVGALQNPASESNIALEEGDTVTINAPQAKRLMVKGEGPRGLHEVDERFGLRGALLSLGFTTNGAAGDLRHARLIRNAKPGEYETSATYIPVDLYNLLTDDTTPDTPFKDLDTLDIPVSQDFVYVFGEIGGPRKQYLPQDRKTYLIDIYSNAGDVTGNAKMGSVKVFRQAKDGTWTNSTYDLGKFFKTADAKNNPEILAHDMIYVPSNNRVDAVNSVWTGWGFFNIIKALVPGL